MTKKAKNNSMLTADELADKADRGEDITSHLSAPRSGHFAKTMNEKSLKRTTIDFTEAMLGEFDLIAEALNISRQAVIKMALQDYLIRYKTAFRG